MHIGVCRRTARAGHRPALIAAVAAAAVMTACAPHGAPPSLALRVVGRDHRWDFEYPGLDGVAGTSDDRTATGDLHLPADIPVRLELHSDDDLYFFGVPALDAKQIAMPDLTYRLALDAHSAGRFDLLGDQMCGAAFPAMRGQLVIEPWPTFVEWLERQPLTAEVARTP